VTSGSWGSSPARARGRDVLSSLGDEAVVVLAEHSCIGDAGKRFDWLHSAVIAGLTATLAVNVRLMVSSALEVWCGGRRR